MPDATTETTAETAGETSADTSTQADAAKVDATTEGESALGDAGKKALDAMKAERQAAKAEAATLRAELAELKAKAEGKEAEFAAEQKAREVESAALSKANDRILKAEVRAAAAGKLANPALALKLIDLSALEVSDDGEVDGAAIAAAIEDLIKNEPYLAAQGGKKFQGTADGGARNGSTPAAQLSRADLAGMTPEAIVAAKAEGRLNDIQGIKS